MLHAKLKILVSQCLLLSFPLLLWLHYQFSCHITRNYFQTKGEVNFCTQYTHVESSPPLPKGTLVIVSTWTLSFSPFLSYFLNHCVQLVLLLLVWCGAIGWNMRNISFNDCIPQNLFLPLHSHHLPKDAQWEVISPSTVM